MSLYTSREAKIIFPERISLTKTASDPIVMKGFVLLIRYEIMGCLFDMNNSAILLNEKYAIITGCDSHNCRSRSFFLR